MKLERWHKWFVGLVLSVQIAPIFGIVTHYYHFSSTITLLLVPLTESTALISLFKLLNAITWKGDKE